MDNFTKITVQKAHEIMSTGPVTIVDIRDAGSYAEGHIEHAQNVNDTNIENFILETNKEIPLICYCYHGISSQRAAAYFSNQEFKQVYSIDGGWEAWKSTYA